MPSSKSTSNSWPENVGILAMEVYFPSRFVCQTELEKFDGASQGKYTIGLGQNKMGFCTDREDINSLCLTVFSHLMERMQLGYETIGRLDVGTESCVDKSKSVKSVLMQLFEESGNTDVEGVDSTNACYGGTAALFNAVDWIESSSWDSRLAVVVAADIAVYAEGAARPTGGAGAVAMLIGPNAPIVIDRGMRSSCMRHVYDFYKPNLSSEYPTVDGKLSIQCYLAALDTCYRTYLKKAAQKVDECLPTSVQDFDFLAFHSPFCKLVQKSFARLTFNDFINCKNDTKFASVEKYRNKKLEETYFDKDVEKAFVSYSQDMFEAKTKPSLLVASQVGNMYTPSLYGGLASIFANLTAESIAGKRIGMFSYGSGLASTFFSLRISPDFGPDSSLARIIKSASDIHKRLESRHQVSPQEFSKAMSLREKTHHKASHTPCDDISILFPGTFYLESIDELHRRKYGRFHKGMTNGSLNGHVNGLK